MKHLHVAVIDPTKIYAKAMAKKSGETDYTMYNLKEGENVLCLYEPHMYPEKIQSLLGALNSSDHIVWVVDGINADFAECALAIWLTGKNGTLVLDGVGADDLAPVLSKSPMWSWKRLEMPNPNNLREMLMALDIIPPSEPKVALVDSCFAVGGVGTVALTKVEGGLFAIHDELEATPAGTMTAIRSIQEQDVDVKQTSPGSRAGFALKNVTPEQVRRGSYLAPPGVMKAFSAGQAEVMLSPLVKEALEPGVEVFFSFGLQYVSGKLQMSGPLDAKAGKKEVGFALIAPSSARVGQHFLLLRSNKRPRVIGAGTFKALK